MKVLVNSPSPCCSNSSKSKNNVQFESRGTVTSGCTKSLNDSFVTARETSSLCPSSDETLKSSLSPLPVSDQTPVSQHDKQFSDRRTGNTGRIVQGPSFMTHFTEDDSDSSGLCFFKSIIGVFVVIFLENMIEQFLSCVVVHCLRCRTLTLQ